MPSGRDLPAAALSLAGFVLAHAAWSISDSDDDELLCPLAVVDEDGKGRRLLRFEAETQEVAVTNGKVAMRSLGADTAAWAFAREGLLRGKNGGESQDILTIDFWARGMASHAALVQQFHRRTRRGRFHLGELWLVLEGRMVPAAESAWSRGQVEAGVHTHAHVAPHWASWHA